MASHSTTSVIRYDAVQLDSARRRRADDGALIVPGRLARVGIQVYDRGDGTQIREWRPPDEVFDGESIASFDGLTITDLHPPDGMVAPDSYRSLSRGHIQNPRQDGDWFVVDFYIKDSEAIRQVESGERTELSAGYMASLDMTPGTTPDGARYDAVQRNIRGNHAAILPSGHARAGRSARLLDSHRNEIAHHPSPSPGREKKMKKITVAIDGIDYALEGDGAAEQALARLLERADEYAAEIEASAARVDEAEQKVRQLEADLEKATDQSRIDAAAKARSELIDSARRVGGADIDISGADREIMLRALEASGVADLQKRSDDYIRARFDARLESVEDAKNKPTVSDFANTIDKNTPHRRPKRFARLEAARRRRVLGNE